jgi:hypothetical protein
MHRPYTGFLSSGKLTTGAYKVTSYRFVSKQVYFPTVSSQNMTEASYRFISKKSLIPQGIEENAAPFKLRPLSPQ